VGVSGFNDESDESGSGESGGRDLLWEEETTPLCAERVLMRCLPCLGRGAIRLLDGLRETLRRCPACKGNGMRIALLRDGRETSVAEVDDEMKIADAGRCKGTFLTGRRAAFGRVACTVCGGRFRPLPGQRVPNHISQRPPLKADPPRGERK
jgi:hypothetical protein